MTDNEATVTVPVSLIERTIASDPRREMADEWRALLPKPTPGRFRVVNLDTLNLVQKQDEDGMWGFYGDLSKAPDVLALIEEAVRSSPMATFAGYPDDIHKKVLERIRTAIEEATR